METAQPLWKSSPVLDSVQSEQGFCWTQTECLSLSSLPESLIQVTHCYNVAI